MKRRVDPLLIVALAFVAALVALYFTSKLGTPDAGRAIAGIRAAVTGLGTGLVGVVAHRMGRNHDDADVRCPLCEGRFPDDARFGAHECARSASPPPIPEGESV